MEQQEHRNWQCPRSAALNWAKNTKSDSGPKDGVAILYARTSCAPNFGGLGKSPIYLRLYSVAPAVKRKNRIISLLCSKLVLKRSLTLTQWCSGSMTPLSTKGVINTDANRVPVGQTIHRQCAESLRAICARATSRWCGRATKQTGKNCTMVKRRCGARPPTRLPPHPPDDRQQIVQQRRRTFSSIFQMQRRHFVKPGSRIACDTQSVRHGRTADLQAASGPPTSEKRGDFIL